MAMNKEFVDLVQEYLADGIISNQEREVLLRKAQKLGVDIDEAFYYIQAQEQKVENAQAESERKEKGLVCPHCKSPLTELADICPKCHEPISPKASKELQEILDNLEDALVAFKSGRNITEAKALVERYARKAKLYYSHNKKIIEVLGDIEIEMVAVERKVKQRAVLNAMGKRWKLIAGVAAVIVLAIVIIIKSRPTVENNLQLCIEAVNEALKAGDLDQAEALCAGYYQNNDDWDEVRPLAPAWGAIIRFQTKELTDLIDSGDLKGAITYLQELSILPGVASGGTSNVLEMYDSMFFKLVTEFVNRRDLDSAETTALIWRSKLNNDMSWEDSSCYTLMKSKYKAAGRDFSALKSHYDYD